MKKFSRVVALLCVCILTSFVFCGCTHKRYELVGIVFDGDTKITPLEEIEDQSIVEYIKDSHGEDMYIKLKQNGDFVMGYCQYDTSTTVEITHYGRFEIDYDNETISVFFKRSDGSESKTTHQYSNNSIIYFDGTYFLAFK